VFSKIFEYPDNEGFENWPALEEPPKEFHKFLYGYQTVRFHFRLQKEVAAFYRDRKNRRKNFSALCSSAAYMFSAAVSQGLVDMRRASRFRGRADKSDKVECIARLEVEQKDFIEKLGFALGLSQAEALRSAMEWFMETVLLRGRREVSVPARWKWHHRPRTPRMESLFFSFWSFGRELVWRFHPPRPKRFRFASEILAESRRRP
jgi:hypothetical protein